MIRFVGALLANVKKQLVSSINHGGEFSLQIDESTDLSNDAQLLVYVCYFGENDLEKGYILQSFKNNHPRGIYFCCGRFIYESRGIRVH